MPASFINLDSMEKLDDLFDRSMARPILIFKHSTTCGVSSAISQRISKLDSEVNLVIVQKNRDISNAIAEKTGIKHETPQAIILRNGEAVYRASHYSIDPELLADEIDKLS